MRDYSFRNFLLQNFLQRKFLVGKMTNKNNKLTDAQRQVLESKGTERPFSSPLLNEKRSGVYSCVKCGSELYGSDKKFDSGSGWPSFTSPVNNSAINQVKDTSHGMVRTEVTCSQCGGHLGHVFEGDGPNRSDRHCINGVVLNFEPK